MLCDMRSRFCGFPKLSSWSKCCFCQVLPGFGERKALWRRKVPCPLQGPMVFMGHSIRFSCLRVWEASQPCSQEGAVESAACTDGSCSIDCEVGTWTAERCTRPCGGGQQVYRRPVVTAPLGRGRICPGLEMWESCNTQECTYPKILAKLKDAVTNFSAGEPVLDVVKSEAEGFISLAKTSHADDVQGKEWGTFVDEVRVLSRDFRARNSFTKGSQSSWHFQSTWWTWVALPRISCQRLDHGPS